jgi:hypothetical protein
VRSAPLGGTAAKNRPESKSFWYNPTEIGDNKANNWTDAAVAGGSHPVYAWSSGGERLITFDLFIDGDRSNITKKGVIDISDELAWYRSLLYPIKFSSQIEDVYPSVVLFTFGPFWQSVNCVVKKTDIKVTFFTANLNPVKATVSLGLAEISSYKSWTADEYLSSIGAPTEVFNSTLGY